MKFQLALFLCSLGLIATSSHELRGQIPPFIDDFEDGSATDGMPVTWVPEDLGSLDTFEVIDGSYVITSFSNALSYVEEVTSWSDVSIQTQLRVDSLPDNRSNYGVWARGSSTGSYYGGIREDGLIFAGINLNGMGETRQSLETTLAPLTEDVVIQLDVVGNEISFSAWKAGDAMPATPQLSFSDGTQAAGDMGLYIQGIGGPSTTSFRYVNAVPEPSSIMLTICGLLGVFLVRRRHSRS